MKPEKNETQLIVLNDSNLNWNKIYNARIAEGPGAGQICKMEEAYELAKQNGLDLVIFKKGFIKNSVNEPAIVKIMDFSKFCYEKKKKEKEIAKKQRETTQKTKEVKFHLGIGESDYNYKLEHIKEFLNDNDRVNCQIVLRGREKFNDVVINEFTRKLENDCKEFAVFSKQFTRQGNTISGILEKIRK